MTAPLKTQPTPKRSPPTGATVPCGDTVATKAKAPVLKNTCSEAVATPTEKRGFVMPNFWGLCACTALRFWGVVGSTRKDGRTASDVFLTTTLHPMRPKTLTVALVTPEGAKTMTQAVTLARSSAPAKPLSIAPSVDGKRFSGVSPDTCFIADWLAVDQQGYCTATNGKGGKSRGHRLAYKLFVGNIPNGAMVLHRCGNEACINPHHLYLGDAWQNARDRALHGTLVKASHLPQAKLTNADIAAIRASRESCIELAKRYGVSRPYVWCIRVGKARPNKVGG